MKIFLTTIVLFAGSTLFSQVNHEDSIYHSEREKLYTVLKLNLKGEKMPAFILKDKNGRLFTSDNLRSKITFINFWFEACAPCMAEFQALEKFYTKNKPKENFQFISITYEQDSVIERIQKEKNLTYPIYHLSHDSCMTIKYNLGFPTNLIVNKTLEIVFSNTGGPIDPAIADEEINYFIQAELDKQLQIKE